MPADRRQPVASPPQSRRRCRQAERGECWSFGIVAVPAHSARGVCPAGPRPSLPRRLRHSHCLDDQSVQLNECGPSRHHSSDVAALRAALQLGETRRSVRPSQFSDRPASDTHVVHGLDRFPKQFRRRVEEAGSPRYRVPSRAVAVSYGSAGKKASHSFAGNDAGRRDIALVSPANTRMAST